MWWSHRQAVLMNHCVKPSPRSMPMPTPRHCPHPSLSTSSCPCPGAWGRAGRGPRTPTLASLHAELMRYLESMFEVALQSTGEDEEFNFIVTPVTRENPGTDQCCVHRGREEAEPTSHHQKPGLLQVASEAEPSSGSKVKLFQITPPPERGGRGRQQQRGGRPRSSQSPGPCRRAWTPSRTSVPQVSAGGGKGPEGSAKSRRPPAERGKVDEPGRAQRAGAVRSATPPGNGGPVARATNRPIRPAAAYRRFLAQYRRALETPPGSGGDGGGCGGPRPQRKAGQQQLKVTKLVEQRHELIRKTIVEKERKELMERKRLTKEKVKRRKTERQIAARMSVCEMEKYRKKQARKRLQSFRKYNREQAARYQAELKEMKERVARAPFLFEQVIQNNVRGTINRLFAKVLQKLHLDEELVCKLSTEGCKGEIQLIELEPETDDWEGVCAPSLAERPRHSACEEPLNTAACQCKQGCDSTNCATRGPATYW